MAEGAAGAGRDRLTGGDWLARAGKLIANLGFEVITGEDAASRSATDLVIALRERPTLAHFDPEEVSHWVIEGGRGRLVRIDRSVKHLPIEGRFAWGRISIADRLGMANQFLSFGGSVRAAALDPSTLVVVFSSPVPIQRWAGHSQGTDPLTEPIGAFFGRMMIPIDFDPGAEARIGAASPEVLYAAFVQDLVARLARSAQIRDAHRAVADWAPAEARRVEAADPDGWHKGGELFASLGLEPGR
ncbi:MAG TPA: hypothetical protein VIV06_05175 [Candidatus Limnocylindrales bacterium]